MAWGRAARAGEGHGGGVSGVGWYARMRGRRCGCVRGFGVCGLVWRWEMVCTGGMSAIAVVSVRVGRRVMWCVGVCGGVRKSPRAERCVSCRSCFGYWAQTQGWHTHATRAHGGAFVCIAARMSAAVMRGVVSASR